MLTAYSLASRYFFHVPRRFVTCVRHTSVFASSCFHNVMLRNAPWWVTKCLTEGNDCAIDPVCPTLFDNGDEIDNDIDGVADSSMELPWANGAEDGLVCTDELAACMNESECSGCIPAVLPEGCPAGSDTGITCDELSELFCCAFGTSDICVANVLLVTYTGARPYVLNLILTWGAGCQ